MREALPSPPWLAIGQEMGQRWLMRDLGWGVPTVELNQFAIVIDAMLVRDDADRANFQPNPRRGFRELLDRPPNGVQIWVDLDDEGIRMPPVAVAELRRTLVGSLRLAPMFLRKTPEIDKLRPEHDGVAWLDLVNHHRGKCFVPWRAVVQMRSPLDGRGWWWPGRLPLSMQREIAAQHPEVWPAFLQCEGVPNYVIPQRPAPIRGLTAPIADKARALRATFARGPGFLVADLRVPGCEASDALKSLEFIAIPFGFEQLPPAEVRTTAARFSAKLIGPDGELEGVTLPWAAVLLISPEAAAPRYIHSWPADFPDEILIAASALQQLAKTGKPGVQWQPLARLPQRDVAHVGSNPKVKREETLHIGRNEQGEWMISLRQPMGPPDASGQRPLLQAQFTIPALGGRH